MRKAIVPDFRMENCFRIIAARKGNIFVEELAYTIGLSPRQLHRKMTGMFGIGVKDYCRILRFKDAMEIIKPQRIGWKNYYDQPHFIKEIKHFTGYTPTKLNLPKNDRFLQYYEA